MREVCTIWLQLVQSVEHWVSAKSSFFARQGPGVLPAFRPPQIVSEI